MLAGWVRQGLLRYRQTQKSLEWFQSIGLQLPKEGTAQGSTSIILTETIVIKAGIDQLGGGGYGCRTKTKAHSRRGGPLTVFAELEAAQQRDVSPRWLPPLRAGNGMPISAFPKLKAPYGCGIAPLGVTSAAHGSGRTSPGNSGDCPDSIAPLALFRNPAARAQPGQGPTTAHWGAQAVRWHCRRAPGPLRGA